MSIWKDFVDGNLSNIDPNVDVKVSWSKFIRKKHNPIIQNQKCIKLLRVVFTH